MLVVYTAFVKKEYGEGGKGFEIGGTKYAVWFDELGMNISIRWQSGSRKRLLKK